MKSRNVPSCRDGERLQALPVISYGGDEKKPRTYVQGLSFVGMERFELSTSSSRTTRANLAALHPDESMGLGVSVGVHAALPVGCKNNKLIRIDVGCDKQFAVLPL